MSDSFIWTLLGHLVCIAQWAAFILVDYAYLGRGRGCSTAMSGFASPIFSLVST